MSRNSYSAEFKAQTVLEVLREEKTLDEIATEKGTNPNMLRNWKRAFLDNAASIFDNNGEGHTGSGATNKLSLCDNQRNRPPLPFKANLLCGRLDVRSLGYASSGQNEFGISGYFVHDNF